MDGSVASDTALRCATAAHSIATMKTTSSRRSVKPDHIASLLRNLHGITICCGMLFLNGSNVKSDGQDMQLDIHERIEDSTLRRQGTEAELT